MTAFSGIKMKLAFNYVRQREREAAARGVKFVSFAEEATREPSAVVREEPPKK
jgi:hypothetical protein